MKNFIKNILISLWSPFKPNKNQFFLFIMGLPRSGSSLLMHILESNNELIGYGEYFIKYTCSKKLLKSEFDIRRKSGQLFKNCKYIVNQVNHHSVTPKLDVINTEKNKYIILIRNPEETISSILILSNNKGMSMSEEAVTSIYIERLDYLMKISKIINQENLIFIDHKDLINDSDVILKKITAFLNLNKPLNSSYQLKKFTQKWGDPSINITQGKIIKTNSKKIKIKPELLEKAILKYKEAIKFLS